MVRKSSKLISSARPLDPLRRFLREQRGGVGNAFKTEPHLSAAHSPREPGPSRHSLHLQWLSQPWVLLPSDQLVGVPGPPWGVSPALCCTPPPRKHHLGAWGRHRQLHLCWGRGLPGMHGGQSWAVIHQVCLLTLSFRWKGSGGHRLQPRGQILPAACFFIAHELRRVCMF